MSLPPRNRYLIVADFDGTLARTFDPSPGGKGVHEAYESAVRSVFGEDGLARYRAAGGLKNRAPAEVVALLLREDPELVRAAKTFFEREDARLAGLVPAALDRPLAWNDVSPAPVITELLVREKLGILLGEIGTAFPDGRVWPEPYSGVREFIAAVGEANQEHPDIRVDTAILSSGHQSAIERTFRAWDAPLPDIVITDDDVRWRDYPAEERRRVKPSEFLFALVHHRWLELQGARGTAFSLGEARLLRDRALYIGDDRTKDGELARAARIPFCRFAPQEGRDGEIAETEFAFGRWERFAEFVRSPEAADAMRRGETMLRILRAEFEWIGENREAAPRRGERFR